jgi:hypothetical protein
LVLEVLETPTRVAQVQERMETIQFLPLHPLEHQQAGLLRPAVEEEPQRLTLVGAVVRVEALVIAAQQVLVFPGKVITVARLGFLPMRSLAVGAAAQEPLGLMAPITSQGAAALELLLI